MRPLHPKPILRPPPAETTSDYLFPSAWPGLARAGKEALDTLRWWASASRRAFGSISIRPGFCRLLCPMAPRWLSGSAPLNIELPAAAQTPNPTSRWSASAGVIFGPATSDEWWQRLREGRIFNGDWGTVGNNLRMARNASELTVRFPLGFNGESRRGASEPMRWGELDNIPGCLPTLHDPQEPGSGIPRCGHPPAHPATTPIACSAIAVVHRHHPPASSLVGDLAGQKESMAMAR